MLAKLSPQEVQAALQEGAVLVDFRLPGDFTDAHIPGAVNVQFTRAAPAQAVAIAVPPGSRVIITSDQDMLTEIAGTMLAQSGLFQVLGSLASGLGAWQAAGLPLEQTVCLSAVELHEQLSAGLLEDMRVVDVREPHEWRMGIIPGAQLLPISQLLQRLDELDRNKQNCFICASGVRSATAASIASQHDIPAVNITGGMNQWMGMRYPMGRP